MLPLLVRRLVRGAASIAALLVLATHAPAAIAATAATAPPSAPATKLPAYDERTFAREASLTPADFDRVRRAMIFFGHKSVGENVMDGLASLAGDPRYRIARFKDVDGIGAFKGPGLGDALLGENGDVDSKFAAWKRVMAEGGLGDAAKIAVFKLCFADVVAGTNVASLASKYLATMKDLETRYPRTTFVYTTVPIVAFADDDNLLRADYNKRIRDAAAADGKPLFDIAAIEATHAGGGRCTQKPKGVTTDWLCAEYADGDNCHLGKAGGTRVARAMMIMFADLLRGG